MARPRERLPPCSTTSMRSSGCHGSRAGRERGGRSWRVPRPVNRRARATALIWRPGPLDRSSRSYAAAAPTLVSHRRPAIGLGPVHVQGRNSILDVGGWDGAGGAHQKGKSRLGAVAVAGLACTGHDRRHGEAGGRHGRWRAVGRSSPPMEQPMTCAFSGTHRVEHRDGIVGHLGKDSRHRRACWKRPSVASMNLTTLEPFVARSAHTPGARSS